jgi:hypothetical protein
VKLLSQLKAIQRGQVKDRFGWLQQVQQYKQSEYETDAAANGTNGHASVGQLP